MSAKLFIPQLQVLPSGGDLYLRCEHCGGMDFKAHVRPVAEATARMRHLECSKCKHLFDVDEDGFLGGYGKIDVRETPKRLV